MCVSAFGTQSFYSCGRFIKTMWLARPFVVVAIVFLFFVFYGTKAD